MQKRTILNAENLQKKKQTKIIQIESKTKVTT